MTSKVFLRILRVVAIFLGSIIFILAATSFILYTVPVLTELLPRQQSELNNSRELRNSADYKKLVSLVSKDIQRFSLKYNSYTSGQSYIVVNTTENRFYFIH